MDAALKTSAPPIVSPTDLTGKSPIVVLAPHPDDESLGCGGLLAHAFAKCGAHVVCMTDGSASHPGSRAWLPRKLALTRKAELGRAVRHLGGSLEDVTWLGYPDGLLGAQDQNRVAREIGAICRRTGARRLFAAAREDHHEDHRTTAAIALRVAATIEGLEVFSYPIWSRWDDTNLLRRIAAYHPVSIDISDYRDAKRAAISAHRTQLGGIIDDDPSGFVLPAEFIDMFVNLPELFWRAPA